jgi:hypothetical protein
MDGRKNNKGTKGNKGGRPSKADEIKLIERLTPMADEAFKQLKKGVQSGDFKFIQLFLAYYAGKPKETKDITSNGESISNPIIIFGEENNS